MKIQSSRSHSWWYPGIYLLHPIPRCNVLNFTLCLSDSLWLRWLCPCISYLSPTLLCLMANQFRPWNVLCWSIRGLNDHDKWDPIRNKIEESNTNIFCLQETKRSNFDLSLLENLLPSVLTNLISALLMVPQEVYWFAGLRLISQLFVRKNNTLVTLPIILYLGPLW